MKALICGITGQDGSLLARYLVDKGYEVVGTSRDAHSGSFDNLRRLGIHDRIALRSMALNDFRSVLQALKDTAPDEVYNLAGQTSVGLSFEQPVETLESISVGSLNLLEAIRFIDRPIRLYNAGSSECFGDTDEPADEATPFRPRSPYGVAKAAAFWQVANYREAYGLFASSGILFNHESPLRPARFVTRKVVAAACRIAAGARERLALGNLRIERDWGWAPEYVRAMWAMLQAPAPGDYVIATGRSHTLEEFVAAVFAELGLDWRQHTSVNEGLMRTTDIMRSRARPQRAARELGWTARFGMAEVARSMVRAEQEGGDRADWLSWVPE